MPALVLNEPGGDVPVVVCSVCLMQKRFYQKTNSLRTRKMQAANNWVFPCLARSKVTGIEFWVFETSSSIVGDAEKVYHLMYESGISANRPTYASEFFKNYEFIKAM
jgi:hypothetical protein